MNRWPLILVLALGCQSYEMAPPQALDEVETPERGTPIHVDRRALLPETSQQELDASRLPLLLPGDRTLLERAIVMSGPHFASWSADFDGITVSLHGTDFRWQVTIPSPPPPSTDQVRGHRARVTLNEGIRAVAWDEAGVSWMLDVECAELADARCVDDDYVRAIAESLARVGGAS